MPRPTFLPLRSRMTARPADEPHRASTPLELLFDLTLVVAAGQLAVQLAAAIEAGSPASAAVTFLVVFFAVWWAWMNFTWFASGYDTDDVPYRLLTMTQMAGVLMLAAGVPAGFEDGDYRLITFGYLVMRLGFIAQCVRAAAGDPARGRTPLRTAAGFAVVQVGWLARLALPEHLLLPSAVVLALLDVAVPLWARRTGEMSWNPRHIAERYGLFTIILLGESLLVVTTAVQEALGAETHIGSLVVVAASALMIVFALWWLSYRQPSGDGLRRRPELAYVWGYGHYASFAMLAALSAGLEVAVRHTGHGPETADWLVSAVVAGPVGLFLVLVWAVHAPLVPDDGIRPWTVLPPAVLILLSPLVTGPIGPAGVILGVAVLCWVAVLGTLLRPAS